MTTEKQEKEFQDPGNFIYQTILASNKKIKKKKKKKKNHQSLYYKVVNNFLKLPLYKPKTT